MLHAFTSGQKGTIRAQSDNHSPDAAGKKLSGTAPGIVEIAHWHARNRLRFTFIGNKVVEIGNRLDVDGLRWSRVQDAANSIFSRKLDGVVHGLQRDLELENDAVGALQHIRRGIHVARFQFVIRAFDDNDPILSGRIDEDRRYSAGHATDLAHVRGVDIQSFKVLYG